MKKYRHILVVLTALMAVSCADWLDVQPSDQVSEETAFSSVAGFRQTLNGVYVELNSDNLYGRALSCGMIEVLAQRYDVSDEFTRYYPFTTYDYTGATAQDQISNIWETAYTLIANLNKILENCEKRRGSVLSDEYYHIIKGEALALRALLHFDLFRLFGPVYEGNENQTSIPYYSEFSLNVAPSLQAAEFMTNVITDLENALVELKDDPVIANGVSGKTGDTFLAYRNLRMNYYAVEALLARASMYVGDTKRAEELSQDIIDKHDRSTHFPFITSQQITASEPDRVFSTEILFGLQNLNVDLLYSSLFDASRLKSESLLAPRSSIISSLYTNINDYRYRTSLRTTAEVGGTNFSVFQKYMGGDSLYMQMIPMLRISEMYYIKAEIQLEKGLETDAMQTLTEFLKHRGVDSPSILTPQALLDDEYRKEFFGEGQLFFYYKRLNRSSIPNATSTSGTVSMNSATYVLPIPDGETQYN
ncbi:RagB/SusD family nutrient uptake outer membrane protein [uncultured Alistipes sp.]|uniref:RagB/SusD family nutrient uptake outer membrane protein n=1 Tax=uncultured Alistipes sp. TaxID=538949 RepID=UPI003208AA5F